MLDRCPGGKGRNALISLLCILSLRTTKVTDRFLDTAHSYKKVPIILAMRGRAHTIAAEGYTPQHGDVIVWEKGRIHQVRWVPGERFRYQCGAVAAGPRKPLILPLHAVHQFAREVPFVFVQAILGCGTMTRNCLCMFWLLCLAAFLLEQLRGWVAIDGSLHPVISFAPPARHVVAG